MTTKKPEGPMAELAKIKRAKGNVLLGELEKAELAEFEADSDRRADVLHPIMRYFEFVQPEGDCLVWTSSKDGSGYGMFWLEGRSQRAHRVMYYFLFGEWPEEQLLHSCDNPPCVAPWHLSPGSHADNMADMKSKGRGRTSPGREGSGNPAAKLTEDDVREIRRRYSKGSGVLQKDLAAEFGVKHNVISRIVNGNSWRHVK